ncbi:sugar phosphate isomerase/epimerase [uncultured Mucilaginibacter sp.]|uniref:sugar phosphate isomerase/epimerase family protein n=1 Tax=uncultured Mucilaginibacter sp. TaxID=797541 RepID=UPI0025DDF8F3|nr:sugar phosphate isomerase/epimerase [uncultured Mucilaginibacter sp.]
MLTIKGPAIFIAQFIGNDAPFNDLKSIAQWASSLGYKGLQLPTGDARFIDLQKAAESKTYADEVKGIVNEAGLEITELSTHTQGQLVAVNPAYNELFNAFAPAHLHKDFKARQEWAVQQVKYAAKASQNLGLQASVTFSGALAWPFVYPWPQRPVNLVKDAFDELGRRWKPILDFYDECGIDLCYELHAGEDLHDGVTFEMFLDRVGQHKRANLLYDPSHFVLQCLDYLAHIDIYHERIKMMHVKDAEFNPTGKQGVYGGYQNWVDRAGRFRSLGDGQVDFKAIFSKMAQYDFPGWAVLEWECALKHPEDGALEGAKFIADHIIRVTDHAFDDFVSSGGNPSLNNNLLGIQ